MEDVVNAPTTPEGASAPSALDPNDLEQRSVDCAGLTMTGEPSDSTGASFAYASIDGGVEYAFEGIVWSPIGDGPFPAALVSHGKGGIPGAYSAQIARTMLTWGLVVVAPRYTHASNADGRNAEFLPAGTDGASQANVFRARKAVDLLTCLGSVDMTRLAAHGHSMGAFVTGEVVGTFGNDFLAASHTAGGTSVGPNATRPATAELLATPYQLHHGEADQVVGIAQDEALDTVLTGNGVEHEFYRYADYTHEQMAQDATMLERVRAWYEMHGVFQ